MNILLQKIELSYILWMFFGFKCSIRIVLNNYKIINKIISFSFTFGSIESNELGSFLLHPYIFLPVPPQFCKFRNWPPQFWDLGVCYGFINPEVNHVAFQMRGCSGSKVCINIDFWIAESGSPIFITDWWIQNDFFQLWIFESGMHILNYELADPE